MFANRFRTVMENLDAQPPEDWLSALPHLWGFCCEQNKEAAVRALKEAPEDETSREERNCVLKDYAWANRILEKHPNWENWLTIINGYLVEVLKTGDVISGIAQEAYFILRKFVFLNAKHLPEHLAHETLPGFVKRSCEGKELALAATAVSFVVHHMQRHVASAGSEAFKKQAWALHGHAYDLQRI